MIGDEQQCPLSTTATTTTTSTTNTATTIDEDKSLTLNGDNTVDDVDDDPESNASSLISEEYHQPFSVTTLDSDDFDSLGTTTSITIPIPAANGNESSICSNSNSNTSNNYGNPLAYSLHTIIEESCEESDADDYYAAKHLRQIKVNASSNNNNNINNNDSHTRSNHNTYGNNDDDDDDDDVDESHGQHNHNGHYGDEIYDGDAVFIQQYDNDVDVDDDDQIEGDYDDDDEVYFNDNHNGHHSPFHTSDSESLPTDSEQFNNYQIAHHVINQMGSMVDSESSVSSGHDDDDYDNDDIGNGNDKESTFSPSSRLEKYFTIGLVSPDAYDYSENVDLQVKEKKKDVVIKEKKNISTTSIDVEEIKISLPQTGHRIEVKSPSSFDGDTLPPTPSPDYNVDIDKPKPTIENDHEIRGRTKIVVDDKIRIQIRSPDRPHQKRPAPQPPGPKPKWSPKTSQPDLIPSVGQASDHLNDWIRRQDFTSSEAVSVEIINSKDDDDYKNDEDDEERQANSSSPTTTIRSSASASTSSTFTPIASQIINPPVKMYSDVNRKNPRRPDRNFNSHNNNHSSNISSSSKIHDEMSKSGGLNCIGDELDFKMLLNRNQKTLSSPNEVNEIFMAGHKKEPKSCLRMKLKKSSLGSLLSSLKISNSPISSLFRSKR